MTTTELNHFSKIIERVAAKHGIALSDDDPILMIHTLNEILLEENSKAHQVLLNNFRSTLEDISQWSQATENKANSLLQASSRNTNLLTEQIINSCFESIDQKIESGFNEKIKEIATIVRNTRQAAIINLLATGLFFIAVLVMVLVF